MTDEQQFTIASFRDASPELKPQMILDGLNHMQSMLQNSTLHLHILNTWCENMPGLISETASERIPHSDYLANASVMIMAIDDLTSEIVRWTQLQKQLINCVTPSL